VKKIQLILLIATILLAGCGKQAAAPTPTLAPAIPTETSIPTDTPIPAPASAQDPTVFGAIGVGDVQGFALESFANASSPEP